MLAVPKCVLAQTAKALWCSDQTALVFVYDDNTYTTGDSFTSNGDGYIVTEVYDVSLSPQASTAWIANSPFTEVQKNATAVVFDTSFRSARPHSSRHWFYHFSNLTDIKGIENLNTSQIETMSGMFSDCSKLTTVDVSNWDMKNVESISEIFIRCSNLQTLNVSNWKFERMKDLSRAFENCSSLKTLDVSEWNVSNVENIFYTFCSCSQLETLDVSKWVTNNVENMFGVFSGCKGLENIDISDWKTGNATNMGYMFYHCEKVKSLKVDKWDVSRVTNMKGTFAQCIALEDLNVSQWKTDSVTDISQLFWHDYNLKTVDVSGWKTDFVTSMLYTFSGCEKMASLNVANWNTENVTSMNSTFSGCKRLLAIDISNWNTQLVTDFNYMFQNCTQLTNIIFGENFSTDSKQKGTGSFMGCPKLRYIDFYASNDANAITEVDRTTVDAMFYGVPRTTVIYLPHGSSSVTDAENVVYTGNDPMAGGGGHGGGAQILKCPNYYSADKTDIEFPRDFRTNKAEYSRTMSTNYGSVVLPYAFKTNADIQAYTLDEEHTETMYFVDAEEIPAHTPFAFKKLGNAEFINEDATGNFGITVKATRSTSAAEGGTPYTSSEHLDGWTTKGYYVNETVPDYDGAFYIAGDKFYKADGALTMYPHRVTFHGAWNTEPSSDSPA